MRRRLFNALTLLSLLLCLTVAIMWPVSYSRYLNVTRSESHENPILEVVQSSSERSGGVSYGRLYTWAYGRRNDTPHNDTVKWDFDAWEYQAGEVGTDWRYGTFEASADEDRQEWSRLGVRYDAADFRVLGTASPVLLRRGDLFFAAPRVDRRPDASASRAISARGRSVRALRLRPARQS